VWVTRCNSTTGSPHLKHLRTPCTISAFSAYLLSHFFSVANPLKTFSVTPVVVSVPHFGKHCSARTISSPATQYILTFQAERVELAQTVVPDYRQPGFDPRQRQRIFSSSLCVQTSSEAHLASYPKGTSRQHLVPRSRMSRGYLSSPLWRLHGGSGDIFFFYHYSL
jgi:hypothetical protein